MLNANWKETIGTIIEEQNAPRQYSMNPLDDILDEDWDEEDYMFDIDDEWAQNCPCDTYGPTACNTSCPRYFECNG